MQMVIDYSTMLRRKRAFCKGEELFVKYAGFKKKGFLYSYGLKHADGDRLFYYVKRQSHVLKWKTIPDKHRYRIPMTKHYQSDYLTILRI